MRVWFREGHLVGEALVDMDINPNVNFSLNPGQIPSSKLAS